MHTRPLFEKIYLTARELDYEIYVVGGFVRDKILGKTVKDIDFVVVGDAMKFADHLKRALHLKRMVRYPRFGTFMARYYDYMLEFVNAREESYSEYSRKPVTRQADLYSDLSRRDFTINTMVMDISPEKYGTIIDVYKGRKDLEKGIIKTPLDPIQTFNDDPLRMMRAIRFATRFNFKIAPKTYSAISEAADRLSIISDERITDEFNKILLSERPSIGLKMLDETGLLKQFLPELSVTKGVEQKKEHHHKDVFYHTLEVVDNIANKTDRLELRLAALFHDIAKPRTKKFIDGTGWTFHGHEVAGERMTNAIMNRLKYSKEMIKFVKTLVRLHLRPMALVNEEVTDSAIRRLIFLAGEQIDDLMDLCRADITSKNPGRVKRYLKNYEMVVEKMKVVEQRDHLRNFQPPVDGKEIMELFDLKPGPMVGKVKKFVEEAILNGDVPNEHDACLQLIINHKQELLEK
ncbi:MAG: CCA tRNA nucleotidyltransferase [Calditrichaceae bacterium]